MHSSSENSRVEVVFIESMTTLIPLKLNNTLIPETKVSASNINDFDKNVYECSEISCCEEQTICEEEPTQTSFHNEMFMHTTRNEYTPPPNLSEPPVRNPCQHQIHPFIVCRKDLTPDVFVHAREYDSFDYSNWKSDVSTLSDLQSPLTPFEERDYKNHLPGTP